MQKGKDLIDPRNYYDALFYNRVSRYSIPSLSQMYANSKFKTAIYKAEAPAPCLDEIFYKYESLIPFGKGTGSPFSPRWTARSPCSSWPLSAGGTRAAA